ncbi:antiviral reverse transcriptase Drt3a [Roseobacter weihaiensis]|uniref:antiviral reverse transcriptase Drt3a n=1 Tax=Roseobacter weihaiensis TaxID=2763262 RepID=UPI001D0B266E|nr:antiviral reverse transcriptase Drt3a [Roseobacter sp. H9]
MYDQTFSAENFRRITEIEQRKGRNPSLNFFPSVLAATEILKDRIRDTKVFRASHRGKYSAADQAIFDGLRSDRERAREARDNELLERLNEVSTKISNGRFEFNLIPRNGPNDKAVYLLPPGSAESYYSIKQVSRNLERIYKVKQANRNRIIAQLQDHLNDGFPYHILRLDVSQFYESIEHRGLLEKLRSDQLLSATSIKIIEKLLWTYGLQTGTQGIGLPRGIGLSASLSELFMRDFDRKVEALQDVVFFARYVDDIVVVFSPTLGSDRRAYKGRVVDQLKELKLTVNPNKVNESPEDRRNWNLTYLGYEFRYDTSTSCKTRLSAQKMQRYEKRLEACFIRYHRQRAKDAKKAYRLLAKRIQYLTSNTQLTHNKSNAFVGIFFGSPHLTDLRQLRLLDGKLTGHISRLAHSPRLQAKLRQYSFVAGYEERIFRRFHRPGQFEEITKAWNYGR